MSDPLGKGLESLIPSKPSAGSAGDPAHLDPPSVSSADVAIASTEAEGTAPPTARTYQDHFIRRKGDSIFWIEVESIDPNPFQPRRDFEPESLQELARSIREYGVLQPILVTKRDRETPTGLEVRYELIAGERRWRAAQLAGISQIPAVIRRGLPDDHVKLELALIENVQREDLNPMDRAKAFKQLVDEFHFVQREIAARVGKSREMVANTLRLLYLPEEVQTGIRRGEITEGHARAILMAGEDSAPQLQMYQEIRSDRLTVREAESRARQISGRTLVPRTRPSRLILDPETRQLENQLEEKLGTKVKVQRAGERGKIVMEFYSEEELRAILHKLMPQESLPPSFDQRMA